MAWQLQVDGEVPAVARAGVTPVYRCVAVRQPESERASGERASERRASDRAVLDSLVMAGWESKIIELLRYVGSKDDHDGARARASRGRVQRRRARLDVPRRSRA